MDFQEIVNKLTINLKLPLPGKVAHQKMTATSSHILPDRPNEFTKKSAVLILFYPSEGEIKLPLILRPAYDGMHGGQVAFPGGRSEKTDENLIRTALREAQEEIGIRISDVQVIGQLTELYIPPSNFLVQPVIGWMPQKPIFYPDPREVDDIFELNLSELADEKIIKSETLNMRGINVEAKIYAIQNQKIWGATAMMISELLAVLKLK
jgi:8-oxo-dGTP pyrophosphatase MutT (NUDIX family)